MSLSKVLAARLTKLEQQREDVLDAISKVEWIQEQIEENTELEKFYEQALEALPSLSGPPEPPGYVGAFLGLPRNMVQ